MKYRDILYQRRELGRRYAQTGGRPPEQPYYLVKTLREGWPTTVSRYAGLCGCGCGQRLLATYCVVKRNGLLYAPEHDPEVRCVRCEAPGDYYCNRCLEDCQAALSLIIAMRPARRVQGIPRGFRKDADPAKSPVKRTLEDGQRAIRRLFAQTGGRPPGSNV